MTPPNSPSTLGRNQKPCPGCGRSMHRQSPRCRACYRAATASNWLTRECERCGKPFRTHVSQTKRGQGRYCSRSCARSGSPTRKRLSPVVECFTCGRRFNKYPFNIAKNQGEYHFCSPACWHLFNRRDNHYLWSGVQLGRMNFEARAWRKAVLRRDRGFCRICHAMERLEVHHIKPYRSHPGGRWDIENGITLCVNCHRKLARREMEYAELLGAIIRVGLVVWHFDGEQTCGANPPRPCARGRLTVRPNP